MEDHIFKAALAGLLHDMRTFAQRAGAGEAEIGEKIVPPRWHELLQAAAGSSSDGSALANIVAEAARLAAGGQARRNETGPNQLLSIFCDISVPAGQQGDIGPPADHYLAPRVLQLEAERPGSRAGNS